MTGRLIAIVGPSGAGKDSLIAAALRERPDWVWARRVITRPETAGGEPYEGVERPEFDRRLAAGAFAFWWEAHGLRYGILADVLDRVDHGATVIFNGSRAAIPAIRDVYPATELLAITAPPSVLARRLAARGRENAADIERRLARAVWPLPDGAVVVENTGTLEDGVSALLARIEAGGGRASVAGNPDGERA